MNYRPDDQVYCSGSNLSQFKYPQNYLVPIKNFVCPAGNPEKGSSLTVGK